MDPLLKAIVKEFFYPQCDAYLFGRINEWRPWLEEQAKYKLENFATLDPKVRERLNDIVSGKFFERDYILRVIAGEDVTG